MNDQAAANEERPVAATGPPSIPATSTSSTTTSTTTVGPTFAASIGTVTAEELGGSWRPACPVGIDDLRRVVVTHWNDRGDAVGGVLVVHADHADGIVTVFGRLFDAGFPIHSMRPVTEFDSDDDRSMQANNTSAFNCREIAGRPGVWSRHAYGGAVDINPLVNPWVRGARVDPPEGAPFVDHDPSVPGLIVAGDVVTEAFAGIGWGWGGDWTDTLDYQHFSHDGR